MIPNGIESDTYILYIKTLLKFVELNEMTISQAKKLFQNATDFLEYHQCNFSDAKFSAPEKEHAHDSSIIKYAMYKEHNLSPSEFVTKFGCYTAPLNLSQMAYFELLMQLDDFIKDKGLTIKQAHDLLSDCIEILLQSK